ncbi:uncharacterized protein TNCV_1192871 [Trichonephila clavipes]|nr:uncharacterized protein TNCV_1192871 [Trichonephila clavipes]
MSSAYWIYYSKWLEHRTPDRKAWVRYPTPPNTLRVHTDFHAEIVEVKIGGDAIYHPFGEFRRAKSYCHLYSAQGQRQAYLLPNATMNFVDLNLTTSGSRRPASSLVRLVEVEERREAPDYPQGVLPQNWGETKLNHSVTCMVLKAKPNDKRHLALCHDEFCGP